MGLKEPVFYCKIYIVICMEKLFNKCTLCPRECKVNRNRGEVGFCRASNKMKIGGYRLHLLEEPILSSLSGSGTIFFSYCNLGCIYCQNYEISHNCIGDEISILRFSDICLELEGMGANNINLVTPTHYIPLIRDGIILARKRGVKIPFVYNCSGYESARFLKLLDGLIDIYLPDFKYYDDSLGKFSMVDNYFLVAKEAIEEMYRQVGSPIYDGDLLKSGLIVRHLVLPGHSDDSKRVIGYLYGKYGNDIIFSIMNQYTPVGELRYNELNRVVSDIEYAEVIDYAYDIGVRNCFVQDGGSQSDSFIPLFKGDCVI